MSTFSDDDLKRLKEAPFPGITVIGEFGFHCVHDEDKVKALIARLEAAERLIEACGQDINVSKQYEAWRRSKGEIADALKIARNEALEEAARIAEFRPTGSSDDGMVVQSDIGELHQLKTENETLIRDNDLLKVELDTLTDYRSTLKAENERYRKALEDIKQLRHFFGGDKRVKFSECLDIAKSALEGK